MGLPMRRAKWALLTLVAACSSAVAGFGQPFIFQAKHEHWRGHCSATLTIGDTGIEYASDKAEHSRKWSYRDLKRIDIESKKKLRLETYEDRKYLRWQERDFELEVVGGEITETVYRLLLSKSTRPLVARVPYPAAAALFTLPVKHRHRLGGCQGSLKVEEKRIVYETEHEGDARIWLYRDISSIARMDPYTLRITTLLETYTFDLKEAMTDKQYDYLWARVYRLEQPYPPNGAGPPSSCAADRLAVSPRLRARRRNRRTMAR